MADSTQNPDTNAEKTKKKKNDTSMTDVSGYSGTDDPTPHQAGFIDRIKERFFHNDTEQTHHDSWFDFGGGDGGGGDGGGD